MTTQIKLLAASLVALALVGGGYLLGSRKPPVTVEKIITQEVVKYVDRVVTKDVVRTETRPDGTKVVTETKSNETVKVDTKTKSAESVVIKPTLTTYSLGVAVVPHLSLSDLRPSFDYEVEVGRRIYSTPAWITLAYSTKGEFKLGLKYEF